VKERILVIDDIVDFQETLLVVLRKAGYQATGAQNGAEALELVQKEFYELIISDVRLPGQNGVETLMQIREIQKGRKSNMVIMSGYSDNESLIKAIQLGWMIFLRNHSAWKNSCI
jgi:two-component system, NtrC family, response regulator HydG